MRYCIKCKNLIKYSEQYNANYCGKCNEWISKDCKDDKCSYCYKRPLTPEVIDVTL